MLALFGFRILVLLHAAARTIVTSLCGITDFILGSQVYHIVGVSISIGMCRYESSVNVDVVWRPQVKAAVIRFIRKWGAGRHIMCLGIRIRAACVSSRLHRMEPQDINRFMGLTLKESFKFQVLSTDFIEEVVGMCLIGCSPIVATSPFHPLSFQKLHHLSRNLK